MGDTRLIRGVGVVAGKRLADAELRPCADCGSLLIVYTPSHLFCDKCLKARDRKRALANYYKRKEAEGLPHHSPMGRPRVPDAPVVLDGYLYSAEFVDGSNRPFKLTCGSGHSLAGDNLHIDSHRRRICMTCKRNALRESRNKPSPTYEEKVEHEKVERQREVRRAQMVAPIAELWPYGAEDPLIQAIAAAMPESIPDHVRADAGQQVYLDCLEGKVSEGGLHTAVQKSIKSAWGEYAISIDWRREDGQSLAETLEDKSYG